MVSCKTGTRDSLKLTFEYIIGLQFLF